MTANKQHNKHFTCKLPKLHLSDQARRWLVLALHIVGITLLAVMLSRFVMYDISSLSVFSPMEKSNDFRMSDMYVSVAADDSHSKQVSNQITIVALDGCNRQDALDVIEIVSEFAPKVIGLDIVFREPTADDIQLFAVLNNTPNLVLPCKIDTFEGQFIHSHFAFYEDSIHGNYGYVNLYANTRRDIVREFKPQVMLQDSTTIFSMPAMMAQLAQPDKFVTLQQRNNPVETIAFDNVIFHTINAKSDILGNDFSEEQLSRWLTGKAVLIGDVSDFTDSYQTPVNGTMAGVLLHAYALNTILSEQYIDSTPHWLNWFIAIVLCVFFTWLNIIAKRQMNNVGNLLMRIVQLFTMYLLLVIGCTHYVLFHQYMDFAPAVLMIGLGALSFDLWFGAYSLYRLIKRKISKR